MRLSIYSVYDSVAEIFNKPFTEINDATAERVFKQSLEEIPNTKNDYVLYRLADYDDSNGSITPCANPDKITSGLDFPQKQA